jgi:putative hydrolase of the HAD superfamily
MAFDYGGTLDGPGSHWLDRFVALYEAAGLRIPFEGLRAAFDYATQSGYATPAAARFDLQQLVEFHVDHQFAHLGITDRTVAGRIVTPFVRACRLALAESRAVLARLQPRVALGVISNFYGNVDRILAEAGMAPLLTVVIDSGRVGLSKPDPRVFGMAVEALGCTADEVLYVGDSFEKDMVGAHAAGLRTAWVGAADRPCRAPELVDVRVRTLAELEALLP